MRLSGHNLFADKGTHMAWQAPRLLQILARFHKPTREFIRTAHGYHCQYRQDLVLAQQQDRARLTTIRSLERALEAARQAEE